MGNKPGVRLRVLMLAEYDQVGGTRTYAKKLITFYKNNNYELIFLAKGPSHDQDMVSYCEAHGVRLLRYELVAKNASPIGRMPWRLHRERQTLNDFVEEVHPDLIVASVGTPGMFLGHMGGGRRSIYILHTYPSQSVVRWRRLINKLIWAVAVPGDIRFVTVSHFARRRMLDTWGLWRCLGDVSVIYSTVGELVANKQEARERLCVLTVGHVVEYKNPMLWIDVAGRVLKELPLVRFIWVGPGAMLESCREKVIELGLQGSVEFVGESNDLLPFFDCCDIYVQPSKIESLGLSVLDAMRHGKPCVVTNVGGLPECICNGKAGYVVAPDDELMLARRLIQLAQDAALREKIGRQGQEVYIHRFSTDRWNCELRALHDQALLV